MKAKDVLTAIQVDASGEWRQLSTYHYVFAMHEEKLTSHWTVSYEEGKVLLEAGHKEQLTLNQLVDCLNQAKEADLYIDGAPIFGYRVIDQGIVLG